MKKLLKIAAVLAVLVLVLGVVSSVLLHILLPPEKAKALVIKQLTGHLHREVQVGPVSVGILTGLTLSDLKVSESPDFAHGGVFLSSDRFSVRLSLVPLLFRKIVVNDIVLKHPEVTVIRYADGKTFNFSDLMAPTTAAVNTPIKTSLRPPSPLAGEGGGEGCLFCIPEVYAVETLPAANKSTEPPFSLVISQAIIQQGVIHFVDRSPAKQSADIDPLDLKLKNVSLTAPFRIQANLKAKAKGVEVALQLVGDADLSVGSFNIKNCALSSGGSMMTLAGKASRLKTQQPSADLKLDIKQFKLATLAPFMALPPEVKLSGPIVGNAQVKGDQRRMDFSARIDLSKTQVGYAKQFSKPETIPMALSLSGALVNLQNVDLKELQAILGSLKLAAHGRIQAVTTSQPQVDLHLETNSFPVAELTHYAPSAVPKDLKLSGNAQLAADVSGTAISCHIDAKFDGTQLDIAQGDQFVKAAGVPLNVTIERGEWVKPDLEIQEFKAKADQIETHGSLTYQGVDKNPKFTLTLNTNTFPLQSVSRLLPMAASYQLSGSAALDVRASGTASAPMANGSLTLQNVAAHYQQSDVSNVVTTLSFTQQDVATSKPATGKLNGSDFNVKFTGHKLTTQPDVTVDATLAQLDMDKLAPAPAAPQAFFSPAALVAVAFAAAPPAALPPLKIAGHAAIGQIKQQFYHAQNLDMKWSLSQVTPDLSRVSGTATLKQGQGKLENVEKLAEMSKAAKLALFPLITLQKLDKNGVLSKMGLPSLQTIPFDGIHGDYTFQSGLMTIKVFELVGHDLNINTQGTIGLAGAQPLDVRVVMKLAPGAVGGALGQLVTDESGRPTLNFTAKGTVSNPQVHMDVQEATHRALQQVGQQLLQGILGGGQNQNTAPPASNTSGSSPAPAAPAPNPVDDLQKTFKSIFH